jgi:transcriptional regulator with GAF, ATPase, and Fis domain
VLETRRYRRLGGTRDLTAEVRILAATNRDLEAMIRTGEFRQDLFFRLSTFPIRVPPLRDRRGDIPALVRYFLAQAGASRGIAKRVSTVAMSQLLEHDWPGNIRELRNAVERASILSGSRLRIDVEDFTLGRPPAASGTFPISDDGRIPKQGRRRRDPVLQSRTDPGGSRTALSAVAAKQTAAEQGGSGAGIRNR